MSDVFKLAGRRLLACFLAGVFAILPLVITVAVVIWVAGFLGRIIGPNTLLGDQLRNLGMEYTTNSVAAYAIGWAVVLGVVFILGVIVEMGAKQLLQRLVDIVLKKIPLIGGIYGTSRQLVGMLDKNKDEADLKGMSVVFCMFGQQPGAGLLGLLVSPDRFRILDREYHIVIIPTAPVPVGGALLFMPVEGVVPAEMSVDGLMSIYVSMGVTASEFMRPGSPG